MEDDGDFDGGGDTPEPEDTSSRADVEEAVISQKKDRGDDQEKNQLSLHLAEYTRLAGENHATFQRQQQQLNTMVALAVGIVTVLFQAGEQLFIEHPEIFVLIPVPFLILSAMHLRDDLKLHAIDEYIFLILRARVIFLTGAKDTEVWRWFFVANRIKFGGVRFWGYFYFLLSLIRYLFPSIIIGGSLYLYVWYDARRVLCCEDRWQILFVADILGVLLVFVVGLLLVKLSGRFTNGVEYAWITSDEVKNLPRPPRGH